ncbi:glycosyltransferase [Burkholderia multivorans]|uniref:glycosyltransferase n=1 Tax=Burkholderia multivorans TaxID=87883 RepID=UPI000D00B210|nr:glycosyltransferase [Burkholderia multivorans]MBU9296697.1 glycosyltransferase [Burkholderia multivorans]PRH32657.1 transferase [Burkholderia multivorans]
MRLLHVISSVDATGGGPIEGVTRLAAQLKLLGHSIDIACLDDDERDAPRNDPFGRVIRLGKGRGKYGFNPKLTRWLEAHASEYDAVVVNGLWQFHGAAVRAALRRRQMPYFVYSHGMLDPWFNRAYPVKYLKKLLYWLVIERRVVNHAKSIVFTSETERMLARTSFPLYRANEAVTVYGTAPPPPASAQAAPESEPAADPRKIILFLGRIHEKKGCDLLIAAFAALGALQREYRLVIAGPDEGGLVERLRGEVVRLGIERDVTWAGMVKGDDKWNLLRSADVFCLPSHQENFGIAVAEALGCGVPVLITDKVNIWREIVEYGAGYAASDTVDGVTEVLRNWLHTTAETKERMRESALACFNEKFHIEQVALSYLRIVGGQ